MFFFIYYITSQVYIWNYQTITNTDIVTNDQPICKNKGRNESNDLSSNYLRFFPNNLGLVFHTTYSCIFHSCYLLLFFPLLHFSSRVIYSCYFHSRIFRPCNFDRIAFSTPAFSVAPHRFPNFYRLRVEIFRMFLSVHVYLWPMNHEKFYGNRSALFWEIRKTDPQTGRRSSLLQKLLIMLSRYLFALLAQ